MPIAKVQLPDGRIGRFEVPEGMSPSEIEYHVNEILGTLKKPEGLDVGGGAELVPIIGSMVAQGIGAPLAAGVAAPFGKSEEAFKWAQNKLDYSPSSVTGKLAKEGIEKAMHSVVDAVGKGYQTQLDIKDALQHQVDRAHEAIRDKIANRPPEMQGRLEALRNRVYEQGGEESRLKNEVAAEGASKAFETYMAMEGARLPLKGVDKGISNFRDAKKSAQEKARLEEERLDYEARQSAGAREVLEQRQNTTDVPPVREQEYAPTERVSYNPVSDVKVGRGRNVNLDSIDYTGAEGSFEKGTKPGMRVGPSATDPLKREADLRATPEPAQGIPEEAWRNKADEAAGRGIETPSGETPAPYSWRYPDRQMRDTPYNPFTEDQGALNLQRREAPPPRPQEPPAQGELTLQPRKESPMAGKRIYQPQEVIYDNLPDTVARQRQQARTAFEGIPYEVVKIAEEAEARSAKVAEANGTPWERMPDSVAEAVRQANEVKARAREAKEAPPSLPNVGKKGGSAGELHPATREVLSHLETAASNDAAGVLGVLAKSKHVSFLERQIAKLLSKTLEGHGIRFGIINGVEMGEFYKGGKHSPASIGGLWDPKHGYVWLNSDHFSSKSSVGTIMHEAVHAIVADWQHFRPGSGESLAIKKLFELANKAISEKIPSHWNMKASDMYYGLSDVREFAAEVIANPLFRGVLDNISISKADAAYIRTFLDSSQAGRSVRPIKTAFEGFLAAIGKMIGWKGDPLSLGKVAFETVTETIKGFEKRGAIESPVEWARKRALEVLNPELSALITTNNKTTLPINRITKASSTTDVISAATGETRLPKKFVDDIGGKVVELPDNWLTNSLSKVSSISALFRDTGNVFVKYLYEFAENSRVMARMQSEIAKEGARVDIGSRNPTKIVDPNAPIPRLKELSRNKKQMDLAMEAINDFGGKAVPSTSELTRRGLKQTSIDTLTVLAKAFGEVRNHINAERALSGLKPIDNLPFYFAKYFGEGDWVARLKDPVTGETLWTQRSINRSVAHQNATTMQQQLQLKGINSDLHVVSQTEVRGNKFNANTSVLQDMIDMMSSTDPRRKVIEQVAQQIHSKRGFAVHSAKRKNVLGGEFKNGSDLLIAVEDYFDGAYNYIENLKISRAINEIKRDTRIPPAMNTFAQEYLNRVRGAVNPGSTVMTMENGLNRIFGAVFGNKLISPIRETLGFRHVNSFRAMTEALNNTWMHVNMLILNPTFALGNLIQSTLFTPDVLGSWKYHKGVQGNVVMSQVLGYGDMFSKGTEFARYRDEFATPRGQIDPTFVQEYGYSYSGLNVRGVSTIAQDLMEGRYGDSLKKTVNIASLKVLSTKAEMFSRLHAHASAFNFAKQAGLTGKELYITAETIANDIMVNYGKADKMALVENTGIAGTMLKPLTTFNNWYWTSTLSYITEIGRNGLRDPKVVIPLLTRVVSTGIFAGITGSTAWTVIDKVWNFIRNTWAAKKILGEDKAAASLSELALEHMSDPAVFGVLDGMTTMIDGRGAHIAGGLMSPELTVPGILQGGPQGVKDYMTGGFMKSAPGIKFGADWVDLVTTTLGMMAGREVTTGDMRNKVKAVLPPMIDRLLDQYDIVGLTEIRERDKSLPRPSASHRGTAGAITDRDSYERGVHTIFGNTLPQQREQMALRTAKESSQELTENRTATIDLMVDNLMYGTGDWDRLMERAMQEGWKGKELNSAIKEAYSNRILEEDMRRIGKGRSSARAQEFERMQRMQRPTQQYR